MRPNGIQIDYTRPKKGPGSKLNYDSWVNALLKESVKYASYRRPYFKKDDIVECMNPSFKFQAAQGTVKCYRWGECTLQSRQFGVVISVKAGELEIRPIVRGKILYNRWTELCYDGECRRVRPTLDVFAQKIRMFKHRWRGKHAGSGANYYPES